MFISIWWDIYELMKLLFNMLFYVSIATMQELTWEYFYLCWSADMSPISDTHLILKRGHNPVCSVASRFSTMSESFRENILTFFAFGDFTFLTLHVELVLLDVRK